MTKKVMNSARLIRTRLAGAPWTPRPERRNESAMMKRVKLVTMMRSPGATDSTVSSATISMMRPLAEAPPDGMRALRSTVCAAAGDARTSAMAATAKRFIAPPACESRTRAPFLRAGRRPLVEVLADIGQSDRTFELLQRHGPQIGEDVLAEPARRPLPDGARPSGRTRSSPRAESRCPAARRDW